MSSVAHVLHPVRGLPASLQRDARSALATSTVPPGPREPHQARVPRRRGSRAPRAPREAEARGRRRRRAGGAHLRPPSSAARLPRHGARGSRPRRRPRVDVPRVRRRAVRRGRRGVRRRPPPAGAGSASRGSGIGFDFADRFFPDIYRRGRRHSFRRFISGKTGDDIGRFRVRVASMRPSPALDARSAAWLIRDLGLSDRARFLIGHELREAYGVEPEYLSLLFYVQQSRVSRDAATLFRIRGGADLLPLALARGLDVRLEEPASHVERSARAASAWTGSTRTSVSSRFPSRCSRRWSSSPSCRPS